MGLEGGAAHRPDAAPGPVRRGMWPAARIRRALRLYAVTERSGLWNSRLTLPDAVAAAIEARHAARDRRPRARHHARLPCRGRALRARRRGRARRRARCRRRPRGPVRYGLRARPGDPGPGQDRGRVRTDRGGGPRRAGGRRRLPGRGGALPHPHQARRRRRHLRGARRDLRRGGHPRGGHRRPARGDLGAARGHGGRRRGRGLGDLLRHRPQGSRGGALARARPRPRPLGGSP